MTPVTRDGACRVCGGKGYTGTNGSTRCCEPCQGTGRAVRTPAELRALEARGQGTLSLGGPPCYAPTAGGTGGLFGRAVRPTTSSGRRCAHGIAGGDEGACGACTVTP